MRIGRNALRPASLAPLIAVAALLAAGCGGGDKSPPATTLTTPTPVLLPPLPVGQPAPASGTLTLVVTSASPDSSTNPAPAAGEVMTGTLDSYQGTPRSLRFTATNGSTPGSATYSFSLSLSASAGLQAGTTYPVGSLGNGALSVTYSEYPTASITRAWNASTDGGSAVTIDSLSGNAVTLHGSTRMQPATTGSGAATGTFLLNFRGTVTFASSP